MKTTGLIFIGLLISLTAAAQNRKIVFVCEHGSAKSVIAAAYFNKMAKEKNIPWEAVARGTHPDAEVSAKTKKLLASDNLLDDSFVPQRLTPSDVRSAKKVVLFTSLPQSMREKKKAVDWRDVQAPNDDFQILRDNIVARITPLIETLESEDRRQKSEDRRLSIPKIG